MGTKGVDNGAPVCACLGCLIDVCANKMDEGADGYGKVAACEPCGFWLMMPMWLGKEAPPGNYMDDPAGFDRIEADDEVKRGKAGAKDEDVIVATDFAKCLR